MPLDRSSRKEKTRRSRLVRELGAKGESHTSGKLGVTNVELTKDIPVAAHKANQTKRLAIATPESGVWWR